jgi:hypothetical protein
MNFSKMEEKLTSLELHSSRSAKKKKNERTEEERNKIRIEITELSKLRKLLHL